MKNVIRYIVVSLIVAVIIVTTLTNIEALNYTWSWGGNRASWTFSDSGYVYPSHKIKLKSGDSLYYNGVVVTSGTGGGGSGDVVAAGDNVLTGINTFSDSLRANGYSIIDDAKITSYLRVTGEVTTDLNFNKGSSTSIGTISTDSLAFVTNNTKRIIIDKNGFTNFTDTVQMLDYVQIIGNLNVAGNLLSNGNITADSIAGIGAFITDVNAVTLKGHDTTHFAHTDTLTTEGIKGIWGFWNTVRFYTTTTFDVSPVFSALVNFANGIETTSLYVSGFTRQGELSRNEKTKIVKNVLSAAGTNTIAHGIPNFRNIIAYNLVVRHDSVAGSRLNYGSGYNLNALYTTPTAIWSDTTNVYYYAGACWGLVGDSTFIRITYTDSY